LLGVRHVPPLAAIRATVESSRRFDPLLLLVFLAIGAFVLTFAITHTQRLRDGVGFATGWLIAFGVLWLAALAIAFLARKLTPRWLPFVVRQGLANLHRPGNRTALLLVSVGLGTFLILTLHLTQHSLMQGIVNARVNGQANALLFDIQVDQRDGVAEILRQQGLPLLDAAPIVTMRIESIKGQPVEALSTNRYLRSDDETASDRRERRRNRVPRWILRREFRSTFTDKLRDSEELVAGEWMPATATTASSGRAPSSARGPIALRSVSDTR
jgi:putative ABC transport system permease protein